jgi:hypothetical protein
LDVSGSWGAAAARGSENWPHVTRAGVLIVLILLTGTMTIESIRPGLSDAMNIAVRSCGGQSLRDQRAHHHSESSPACCGSTTTMAPHTSLDGTQSREAGTPTSRSGAVISPEVPGAQPIEPTRIGRSIGDTIRAAAGPRCQRDSSGYSSKCAFSNPASLSAARISSDAARFCGDPVRRPPIVSVGFSRQRDGVLKVAITP